MDTTFGAGERVIKSWYYSTVKGIILTKGHGNLTVTNRRIIATTETKKSLSRDEMPIDNITGVSASYYSNFSLLFILAGIILCLTLALIPVGVALIRKGTGTSLNIVLGNMPSEPIITTTSIRKLRKRRLKVKVNKAAAKEICEQLSTIIFVDLKN